METETTPRREAPLEPSYDDIRRAIARDIDLARDEKWRGVPDYIYTTPRAGAHWSAHAILATDPPYHVHAAINYPGQIAYYATRAHLAAGRFTTSKPGRFIARFYPYMTQAEITRRAELYIASLTGPDVSYCETAAEILAVYRAGVSSCMSHPVGAYLCGAHHPTSVYNSGDFALAHIGTSARAMTRKSNRTYAVIYGRSGKEITTLRDALSLAGYREDSSGFRGARLTLTPLDAVDQYVCPYLDGNADWVAVDGDYLLIGTPEDVRNDSDPSRWRNMGTSERVTGVVKFGRAVHMCDVCEDVEVSRAGYVCEECMVEYSNCANCHDRVHAEDVHIVCDDTYCERCYRRRCGSCAGCEDSYHNDQLHTGPDDDNYCEHCLEQRFNQCVECEARLLPAGTFEADCGDVLCIDCHDPHECTICHTVQLDSHVDAYSAHHWIAANRAERTTAYLGHLIGDPAPAQHLEAYV